MIKDVIAPYGVRAHHGSAARGAISVIIGRFSDVVRSRGNVEYSKRTDVIERMYNAVLMLNPVPESFVARTGFALEGL